MSGGDGSQLPLAGRHREPHIFLLSTVLGKAVADARGRRLGTITDLVVRLGAERHPPLAGLLVRVQSDELFVPHEQIAELHGKGGHLGAVSTPPQRFARRADELLLSADVLDRQLVDVNEQRVIRVNDLHLAWVDSLQGGAYRLIGAEFGGKALIRRFVPARFAGRAAADNTLDWGDLEYFASHAPEARLHLSHERITHLHPVEIARLLDALAYRQGVEIIEALDDEVAAEVLQELTEERGADIVGELDEERAADILEEMDPGAAADLLQDLPEAKAEGLLERMEPDDREDLQELLGYHEDTAGGIMTNSFVTVPVDWTTAEALAYLRTLEPEPDLLYYLYVVPKVGSWRLVGVTSLRDLLIRAAPDARLDETMVPAEKLITVHTAEAAREVARTLATYNLVALPVLDDEGDIVGVVTVDDAMDLVLPEEWRLRGARESG